MADGSEIVCCWAFLDLLDEIASWDAIMRISRSDVVPDFEACAEVLARRVCDS